VFKDVRDVQCRRLTVELRRDEVRRRTLRVLLKLAHLADALEDAPQEKLLRAQPGSTRCDLHRSSPRSRPAVRMSWIADCANHADDLCHS
jgi:hypothetical protein